MSDENTHDDDKYAGVFDHLTPEDFNLDATTAISEIPRTNHGVDAFNSFTEEQLRAVHTAFMASEGHLQPIALLANETTQRAFTPDDEETVAEFIKRLNREAQRMRAVWTFYACKTLVSVEMVSPDDEQPDVNDPEEIAAAVERGQMQPGVLWYSERREGDEQHRRQGVMAEAGPGRLGPTQEASALQSIALLALILG